MLLVRRRPDAWLVTLGFSSLIAWSVLTLDGSDLIDLTLPAFCSGGAPWAMPLSVSFDLAFLMNSPTKLAFLWALMICAMMSPLVIAPLRYVRERSFATRRARSMLLFVAGYGLAWMIGGVGLEAVALAAKWAAPTQTICLCLIAASTVLWQVSPGKQWCLNRCHRRPHLVPFGAAADRDVFGFGLTNGASCVGTCWALMFLPLFLGHAHIIAMIVISLFVFAERLERPSRLRWSWRGPNKMLRIALNQMCMRLAL